ncbi:MAG: hypothetical protein AAF204_04790 [Pseudomonadota bacterium]
MRLTALYMILAATLIFPGLSLAADEFGERFSADSPSALQDPEKALADIMPAAGDDEIEIEADEDGAYYNTDDAEENAAAQPIKVEDEADDN